MHSEILIRRTSTSNSDSQKLVLLLDNELWNELKEDQATYDPHNKLPDIKTAVLLYANTEPVACGCYKPFSDQIVEIKRMFVRKDFRGKGLSKQVLYELEQSAMENGFCTAILETSVHFATARSLYVKNGYEVTGNYPPYIGLTESVCMKKDLVK